MPDMKDTKTWTSLTCLRLICKEVAGKSLKQQTVTQNKWRDFSYKKRDRPLFNVTRPLQSHKLYLFRYTVYWRLYELFHDACKHLYSTLCCEATKRLHQLNESQVVLLTQHLGIRATQHSHCWAERVLDKLVGCLLTQRHDSFN